MSTVRCVVLKKLIIFRLKNHGTGLTSPGFILERKSLSGALTLAAFSLETFCEICLFALRFLNAAGPKLPYLSAKIGN